MWEHITIKLWVCLLSMLIGAWVLEPLPAEGACTQSRIEVLTQPLVIGPTVPVTWRIAPPCDIIETGLLVGTDPSTLEPAGERIFGLRSTYDQVLSVSETRGYWIGAYVMDENGNLIHSAPRFVPVLVPPAGFSPRGPHGSHGAPPSYTGTDADFLQPAGEPHFASLRRLDYLLQSHGQEAGGNTRNARVLRIAGSTHPEEVLASHTQAVTVGGLSLAANPADVSQQIEDLTQNFTIFEHPRPGFYVVQCESAKGIDFGEFSFCFAHPGVFRRDRGLPDFLSFTELFNRVEDSLSDPPISGVGTASTHTTASYFIPGVPPGSRLPSAKLRLVLHALGELSPVRINGKAPERLDGLSCAPSGQCVSPSCFPYNTCSALGTWDFTEEAAALAGQGGGELTITADPIPPAVVEIVDVPRFFQEFRFGSWFAFLDVNYPWSHGGELGALTLSFQQACPKDLKLIVTPNRPGGFQQTPSVLPSLPGTNTVTDAVRNGATMATVDAMVKSCPPQGGTSPASVTVQFSVQAPTASDEAGGHTGPHTGPRPTGTLDKPSCVVMLDSEGMGSCDVPVTYRPSEVSGVETILATAPDFPTATGKLRVEVPGLVNLAEVSTNFFRLTGQTTPHPDNHWGTVDTVNYIQLVALDFFEAFNAILNINDMSLRQGGLFDICGTWNQKDGCTITRLNGTTATITKGHSSHRTGTSVDVDRTATATKDVMREMCRGRKGRLEETEDTIHCEWPR